MILHFSKKPSDLVLELVTSANTSIRKLNELTDELNKTQTRLQENKNIKHESLPLIEDQQYSYTKKIAELESRKKSIMHDLQSLGALHIMEKKRLSCELQKIEHEISVYCNNFSRNRENYDQVVNKYMENKEYIASHPIQVVLDDYANICNCELNPTIKRLSNSIKLKLQIVDPNTPQKLDEFAIEITTEEIDELQ